MLGKLKKFFPRPFAMTSLLIFLMVTLIALVPTWRESLRAALNWSPKRQVLSTARTDILGTELFIVAVKVKTPEGLHLEVYEERAGGLHVLLDKVLLPFDRDGWIQFKGEHSNLILYDVSGDGVPEFLVPTFDPMRTPHLSVFQLDLETRTLRLQSLPSDFKDLPF